MSPETAKQGIAPAYQEKAEHMARTPRYAELAAGLRQAIVTGKLKVGDQLPTEHALCDIHDVSRHTARAALQMLEDEGLIERRPGLGTSVISAGTPPAFSQPLGGLDDLLQYAHKARLKIIATSRMRLAGRDADRLGAPKGLDWLVLQGVRIADRKPIAATTIYVNQFLGPRPEHFKSPNKAITEHIEDRFGVAVATISQTIRAELLDAADAALLGAKPGDPILRTIRRYADASDRMFLISDSRHPAARFAYEMSYRRADRVK